MKFYSTILSLSLIASLANAAPWIDPALKETMDKKHRQSEQITAIVLFKDSMPKPKTKKSLKSYKKIRKYMLENTKLSQASELRKLRRQFRGSIKHKSLPFINGAIIRMPISELKALTQNKNIKAIWANHKLYLNKPQIHRTISDKDNQEFTYGLEKINIPQIWAEEPNIKGEGINVGIIDTGIEANHPDLTDRTVAFLDLINKKEEPYDDQGHGTHVAGTISGGNASGIAIGVAPKVKLTVAKFLDKNGRGTFAGALQAMEWMTDPDRNPETKDFPTVVSNSWGGGRARSTEDPSLNPLCQAVSSWKALGIVPIFAAGNSGPRASTIGLPAACPDAIAIGATDDKDKAARFSSRGPVKWKTGEFIKPQVSAPGVKTLSTVPGGKYKEFSGTSMATPHVSGVVALIQQKMSGLSVTQVEEVLKKTSQDLGEPGNDNIYGMGRVDAYKSIQSESLRGQFSRKK